MIENENQYRVTTEQLAKLESGLASMPSMPPAGTCNLVLWQAQRDGLQSQIDELREQLAVWDKTKEEIQPMAHAINLTPAQRQRLQVILSVWAEMLACEPSLEEPEDEQLLAIIGTEEEAE